VAPADAWFNNPDSLLPSLLYNLGNELVISVYYAVTARAFAIDRYVNLSAVLDANSAKAELLDFREPSRGGDFANLALTSNAPKKSSRSRHTGVLRVIPALSDPAAKARSEPVTTVTPIASSRSNERGA
jgi:hypothetical protein